MTVYVDHIKPDGMCHMATDDPSLEELYSMAEAVGLKRYRIQKVRKHPHFDLNVSRRWLAILRGAVPVDSKELYRRCFGGKHGHQ